VRDILFGSNGFRRLNPSYGRMGSALDIGQKTDRLPWEKIWMTGVNNRILFLMESEFIVAPNAARGFIPARFSERMVSLQGGDCRPTKRRGTRSGQ
jgi:hypothetical protein